MPQGAVLSPALYNIYTADAPRVANCMRAFFADDTALIVGHKLWANINFTLEIATNCFKDYFSKWKNVVNSNKTQVLLITKRRRREIPTQPFIFDQTEVEWQHTGKYLGVILDKTLTMRQNAEYMIEMIKHKNQ